MNLSELFIRRPVMTVALTVSVILFGLLAYFSLPVNDLPAVDYPVIQVQVNYPGATPETMANNVATPLERQFMQIPGLELVTSSNTPGPLQLRRCSSTCRRASTRQRRTCRRRSRARQGQLPVDLPSPPTFTKTNPNDQPIMYIALASDTVTEGQLYDYANTQVGERISILPGVSQVASLRHAIGGADQGGSLGDGGPQHHAGGSDQRDQERHQPIPGPDSSTVRTARSCCSRRGS